jgi:hypothetical protein
MIKLNRERQNPSRSFGCFRLVSSCLSPLVGEHIVMRVPL